MKNIEINEKQKENLLEMCEKLFPEYTLAKQPIMSNMIVFDNSWFNGQGNNIVHTKFISIHWFEFCCKKLAFQIYNFNIGKTKTTYSTFVGECIITSTFHPIDYLYKEFKEYEKN